jgi:7,8-dihydro-6-hydroxymethylpterin-pyrophosphokinase
MSALKLLQERVLSMGGNMPSEKALQMAVKAMASRAHRENKAQASQ